MFIEQPSPLYLARQATQIHAAEGADLRTLSNMHGLPWIAQSLDESTQRAFLRATAYSAKGAPAALFRSLRTIFRAYERTLTSATLTPNAQGATISHPELTDEDADTWLEWAPADGSPAQIYHARAAQAGAVLTTPARTTWHQKPPLTGSATTGQIIILPFTISEPAPADSAEAARGVSRPCEVIINTTADTLDTPPTYLRELDTARIPPEPHGGHIMDLFDGNPDTSQGDQTLGPYPLYLPSDGETSLSSTLEKLLAAGIKLRITL